MKKIVTIALAALAVASAYSQEIEPESKKGQKIALRGVCALTEELTLKKIGERNQEAIENLSKMPMSSVSLQPSWTRGSDTNDVIVSVFVGSIRSVGLRHSPIFRNLTFDKDGKLKSVSKVFLGNGSSYGSYNPSDIMRED